MAAFAESRRIEEDPQLIWCVRPQCGSIIRVIDRYQRRAYCPKCRASMCVSCKRYSHGDYECDDAPLAERRQVSYPI